MAPGVLMSLSGLPRRLMLQMQLGFCSAARTGHLPAPRAFLDGNSPLLSSPDTATLVREANGRGDPKSKPRQALSPLGSRGSAVKLGVELARILPRLLTGRVMPGPQFPHHHPLPTLCNGHKHRMPVACRHLQAFSDNIWILSFVVGI